MTEENGKHMPHLKYWFLFIRVSRVNKRRNSFKIQSALLRKIKMDVNLLSGKEVLCACML